MSLNYNISKFQDLNEINYIICSLLCLFYYMSFLGLTPGYENIRARRPFGRQNLNQYLYVDQELNDHNMQGINQKQIR
jgi:hypothetical protein